MARANSLRSADVDVITTELATRLAAADPLPSWAWSARSGGSRAFFVRRGPFVLRITAGQLTAAYVLRPYTARVIQAPGLDGFALEAGARAIAVGGRRGPWVCEVVSLLELMRAELRAANEMLEERSEGEIDAARDSIARWQLDRHQHPTGTDILGAEPPPKKAPKI